MYKIFSNETNQWYTKSKLPKRFKKIRTGQIYKEYKVQKLIGYVCENRVTITRKED